MPTIEDVSKVLTGMTSDKYLAAVSYIYYLANMPLQLVPEKAKETQRKKQIEFVKRTAGKIEVDEKSIEELRMRSMI
jgi:hypothetical protein